MKLTLEMTRDQYDRPVVLATLEGGWPTVEECRAASSAYHNDTSGPSKLDPDVPPFLGGNPRTIAGKAAADFLGGGGYRHPTDEFPNADGALVFVGGPATR